MAEGSIIEIHPFPDRPLSRRLQLLAGLPSNKLNYNVLHVL